MKVVRRQRWREAGRFEAAGVCRWCGRQVPRPRRFCDDPQCKVEIRIRAEPRFARRQVGRRDHGVCQICGCDTLKLYRVFKAAARYACTKVLGHEWCALGFHGHWWQAGCRWQADHIIPVVNGGGGCGLDNLRTLCVPCHKAETAALCRDLATRRRNAINAPQGLGDAMKIGDAFPSKYLKAANIPDGQTARVRIDHVGKEDVSGKGEDPKPVLYFVGKDKGMVLNKTNARIIEAAYGDETNDWHAKPLEIYVSETQYAGDMVPCLRVRVPKANSAGSNGGGQAAPVTMAGRREQIRSQPPAPSPVSEESQFEEADIPF